jgi:sulfur-oxidizing protein SoxX
MGSSLQGYGKLRGNSEPIVKYTYEKIYNAKAYNACSSMPRLGHKGILSPQQVADLTAYLLDPASPINQ